MLETKPMCTCLQGSDCAVCQYSLKDVFMLSFLGGGMEKPDQPLDKLCPQPICIRLLVIPFPNAQVQIRYLMEAQPHTKMLNPLNSMCIDTPALLVFTKVKSL